MIILCCQMILLGYKFSNLIRISIPYYFDWNLSVYNSILKHFSPCCFLTGPKASPTNVTADVVNSTSISVSWGQVPLLDQNGVILSYTVTYISSRTGSPQTKNVTAPANQTTLTGLNEHTNYSITVFASTSKGGGTKSTPIVIITDEDSKCVIVVSFL